MKFLTYKYYDSPEGQDIFMKTFALTKYSALAGLTYGTFDMLMYSHPKGFVNTVGRYMWIIGPLVGMTAAFTVTTNAAQNIRGKNDGLNYFLGGAVAGAIFGAWQRSAVIAVPMGCILGAAAAIQKTAHDEGWDLNPDIIMATKTATSAKNDWTFVKDIPELKTWTTGSK